MRSGYTLLTEQAGPGELVDCARAGGAGRPPSTEAFAAAGFPDLALVQIGTENQPEFRDCAEQELLPALQDGVS